MKKIKIIMLITIFILMVTGCSFNHNPAAPINLKIDSDILTWSDIKGIKRYYVSINDEVFEVNTNAYDLNHLTINSFYSIKVKTKYSEYSKAIDYHTFKDIVKAYDVSYLIDDIDDLEVIVCQDLNIYKIMSIDDQEIGSEFYQYQDDKLIFLKDIFLEFEVGKYQYYLYTNLGKVLINIDAVAEDKPHIISPNVVTFNNEDLLFEFELYGGKIVSISGSDISDSDYSLDGEGLIIRKEYVEKIFTSKPNQQTIILSYLTQTVNDNNYLGYIFIHRNELD